jgi:FkbM family methyltransferase
VRDVAQARVTDNRLTNVTFLPFGLGEDTGAEDFYLNINAKSSGTGSFLPDHDPFGSFFEKLEIRNGDAWIKESCLSHVDLIKIDVEGLETEVLSGLRNTISESKPCILFEVSPSSFTKFDALGGIANVFPETYSTYEVVRGRKILFLFQDPAPRLKSCKSLPKRAYGYNVLAVPDRFTEIVAPFVIDKVA